MPDFNDILTAHQSDITRLPRITPKQELHLALRVEAGRKRYHLAALRLEHVARTVVALFERVRAGDITTERASRLAQTELLTRKRLAELGRDSKGKAAESRIVFAARLETHLPTCRALLAKCGPLFRSGEFVRLAGVRTRLAKLLYELGVKTAKIDGLVAEAGRECPEDQNETAESLRAAVGLAGRRRAVYEGAKRAMVTANLRLVWQQAKGINAKVGRDKETLADFIQDGYTGLIRAVDKFQPRFGYRFSTSAVRWIVQAMRKAVGDHGRTVRVPSHTRETASLVYWARAELERAGEEATYPAIVARVLATKGKTITEAEAERADAAVQPVARYDDPDGDDPTGGAVAGVEPAAEGEVAGVELRAAIGSALAVLPYRQRMILGLTFGMGDGWRYTLEECGRIFRTSRQWAQQVRNQAIAALRQQGILDSLSDHL